jgi:glutathione-regulated potassium-efflux system ancillary protein KefC
LDPLWLLVALTLGLLAQRLMLPPLVGFLAAGFVLHAFGEQGGTILQFATDLGVELLLFTIGLKFRPASFLSPAVWVSAPLHMLLTCLVIGVGLSVLSVGVFVSLDWNTALLLAFAFSFSSTVLAVKLFEERGEMRARHALIAVGILIIQDLLAVGFLLYANEAPLSWWALSLLLLPVLRPVLLRLLKAAGHGEMLVLYGLTVTIAGAALFDTVGLKDDFGALVFGALLSNHPKSIEMSRVLMGFKDFFLIGFFLSIGLIGFPSLADLAYVGVLIALVLPLKLALFFYIFTLFRLRARTAFLSALGLLTFSEFGLIVASESVLVGLLDERWLVIIAIAVAISFVIASIMNVRAHELYSHVEQFLCRFESPTRLPEDAAPDFGDAEVLVVGMGRVGRSAYHAMKEQYGNQVCGVDVDLQKIAALTKLEYNIIVGDAEDLDFWRNITSTHVRLVMLALPTHSDTLLAARWLKTVGFQGHIGAVAKYEDERAALLEAGVDAAFNYYTEVGVGFADHVQLKVAETRQD